MWRRLAVHGVRARGEEAEQFALRAWQQPAMTLVVGVARTGRITTMALTRTAGAAAPNLAANRRMLVWAVDDLCPTTVGGHCSALPKATPVDAPTAGDPPEMLSAFDLAPGVRVHRPWA